jgi:hypothetical protein
VISKTIRQQNNLGDVHDIECRFADATKNKKNKKQKQNKIFPPNITTLVHIKNESKIVERTCRRRRIRDVVSRAAGLRLQSRSPPLCEIDRDFFFGCFFNKTKKRLLRACVLGETATKRAH